MARKRVVGFSLGGAILTAACLSYYYRRAGRDEQNRFLQLLDATPGEQIGEVGAGHGDFMLLAAARVGPNGRVYANELDPKRAGELRTKAAKQKLAEIHVIEGAEDSTRFPDNCCDTIYLRGVYHHFTKPAAVDASILRALRPGGRLIVVDFPPRLLLKPWTPKGIPANRGGHGISQKILIDEITDAGFRLDHVEAHWPNGFYCVVFRKRAAAMVA